MLSDQTRSKHIRVEGKNKGSYIVVSNIWKIFYVCLYIFFIPMKILLMKRQQKIQRDKQVHEEPKGWRKQRRNWRMLILIRNKMRSMAAMSGVDGEGQKGMWHLNLVIIIN